MTNKPGILYYRVLFLLSLLCACSISYGQNIDKKLQVSFSAGRQEEKGGMIGKPIALARRGRLPNSEV